MTTNESCACSRVVPAAEKHPGGTQSEMHECAHCGARFVRARAVQLSPQREQTAATILAALLRNTQDTLLANRVTHDELEPHSATIEAAMVTKAVALADALRAELAKVPR